MMFLLGYIGAPPTITVLSWANVVPAVIMPSANAVTAAVVSAAFRARFMKSSGSACRSHERSRSINTEGARAGMPGRGSQARELAAGDDRTGRQSTRRAARRLQGNRKRCVGCNALDRSSRKIDMNRPPRLDQAERSWLVAGSDEPKLQDTLLHVGC